MEAIPKLRNAFLNLAFPQCCHVCSALVRDDRLGVACSDCWSNANWYGLEGSYCAKCGAVGQARSDFVGTCHACDSHYYDSARSLGNYEKALSAIILHLKRVPVIPRIIKQKIEERLDDSFFECIDLVMPTPLSQKRLTERGFNQAELVAELISKKLGVPVDNFTLVRKVHTPMHRAAMDRKAREMTVLNAFSVKRPHLVAGRSILLVDDIFTSGATASNCAKVLKKAGAARVNVFTLARAI